MFGLSRFFVAGCVAGLLGACASAPTGKPCPVTPALSEALTTSATKGGQHHPHSNANPEEVRVRHMGLQWKVDFDQRRLEGVVRYRIDRPSPNAPLVLDTQGLEILSAFISDGPAGDRGQDQSSALVVDASPMSWSVARWSLGSQDPLLGRPLAVQLSEHTRFVEVRYRTTAKSAGLQWLSPEQTDDQSHPFLYSQSQPIFGRSWLPMQDTPAVRVTYDATVKVPKDLRALMSAELGEQPPQPLPEVVDRDWRVYSFRMPQAIPGYLIALAVGRLEFAPLGKRSGVWAAPSQLAAARYEFQPVEDMIEQTEELFGPYRWGRYDILVLPAAFPFGGMENPRMTFATPTILAKDRSLISLIAHELAHSWSGNLVTNANWNDIWLNEGFTTYAERRIIEALYGKKRAEMEAMLGRQDLQRTLKSLEQRPDDQRLAADATGRDPDILLSNIAYEKGALFLRRLEEAYGRAVFDPFIRAWFDEHAFETATTADFESFVQERLLSTASLLPGQSKVELDRWLREPGLPADAPSPQSDAMAEVDQAYEKFLSKDLSVNQIDYPRWSVQQKLHFLRKIDQRVDDASFAALDRRFRLTGADNREIAAQWLELSAKRGYAPARSAVERFLVEVGRRKFLMPIYSALIEGPWGLAAAQSIFDKAKGGYHALSRESVQALLRQESSQAKARSQ